MSKELKTITDEACDWIARINSGAPTPEQRQQLKEWMRQSPQHEAEIKRMAHLWHELNVLTELAVSVDVPRAKGLRVADVYSRFANSWRWSGGALLATAVIVMIFTLLWPQLDMRNNGVYITDLGEQKRVTLGDKSTILLNTNSRVSVKFTENVRNVYLLQGEAHFDVYPNPRKPFRVYAGKSLSHVVGTAFSVYLQDDVVELTVTEGRVAFNAAHALVATPLDDDGIADSADVTTNPVPTIEANQRALFNQSAEVVENIETVSASEMSRELAWQTGMLHFSGNTLEEVIAEMSRYTSLSIVIVDPKLRNLRIGGIFKVGETEKMLRTLESSFDLHVDRINDNIVHLSSISPIAQ